MGFAYNSLVASPQNREKQAIYFKFELGTDFLGSIWIYKNDNMVCTWIMEYEPPSDCFRLFMRYIEWWR